MTATAHAVQPPAHAPAPPVQRKADPMADQQEAPQRLLTSLSAVPAVQRACASCAADDPAPSLQSAHPSVQRKCAACATEDHDEKMPVQPQLEVGPVDDPYEREADDIAGRVMAMRDPGTASQAGSSVQRACAACSSKSDEVQRAPALTDTLMDDDAEVPRMRAQPGGGGEHITASAAQLTSGGSSLSDQTRSYFETRMGRDLSDVRVHRGPDSDALNSSISARAFTFQNHIWLSGAESEGPSFTMAHELAHVLQQTQPGALDGGAHAKRSGSKVQREIVDEDLEYAPKGALGPRHDAAVTAATGVKGTIFGEMRVPNANRIGMTTVPYGDGNMVGYGYADLVIPTGTQTNLWGLGFVGADASGTPHDWSVVDTNLGYVKPKSIGYPKSRNGSFNGKTFSGSKYNNGYFDKSAPRWSSKDFVTSGGLRDGSVAPTNFKIGEMKFGGIKDRETMAQNQVDNYIAGWDFAKNTYNTMVDQSAASAAGSNSLIGQSKSTLTKATLNSQRMSSGVGSSKFTRVGTTDYTIFPSKVKESRGVEKANDVEKTGVQGGLYFRQAPSGVLWEYRFLPNQPSLFGPAAYDSKIDTATAEGQKLQQELFATPSGKGVKTRRRKAAAQTVRLAKPMVQPRKPRKPPPANDPFKTNYSNWTERQQKFTTSFGAYTNPATGTGLKEIGKLKHDTALINAKEAFGNKAPSGMTFPKNATRSNLKDITKSRKTLNAADLIAGKTGRVLGGLRKMFGGAYIKVVNVYQGLKTKFQDFWTNRRKTGRGSGKLAKAIMRIGGKIIAGIFREILPEVGHLLMNCVEQGFRKLLDQAVKDLKAATIGDDVDKILADLQAKADEIEKKIQDTVDEIAEGFGKDYEALMNDLERVGTLVRIAKAALNFARIATCVVGGLETFGVACAAALGDFILGLFGYSPTEAAAEWVFERCEVQEFVAGKILALDDVKALPRTLSQTVVDTVRPVLSKTTVTPPPPLSPFKLSDMMCEKIAGNGDLPTAKDVACGNSGPGGSGTGGGGGGGGGKGGGGGTSKTGGGGSGGNGGSGGTAKTGGAGTSEKKGGSGSAPKSTGTDGGSDGEKGAGSNEIKVIKDPKSTGKPITNTGEKWTGDTMILSGFDLDNPPKKNTHLDVRIQIAYGDVALEMTQQIVFLEIKTYSGVRYVRCYLPKEIKGESAAVVGPYDLPDMEDVFLHRGPSNAFSAKVKGQK